MFNIILASFLRNNQVKTKAHYIFPYQTPDHSWLQMNYDFISSIQIII